ncbi:hypothetical protein ScPMuIL_015802 [Solemya velum]
MRVTFVLMVVALVMTGTNVSGAGPSFCSKQLRHCLGKLSNLSKQTMIGAALKKKCWDIFAQCSKQK